MLVCEGVAVHLRDNKVLRFGKNRVNRFGGRRGRGARLCGFWCTLVGKLFVEDVRYIEVQVLNCEGEVCGEVSPALHQRGLEVGETLNHIVTDFNQYSKNSGGIANIAARFRGGCGVRRGRRGGRFVGDIVVVIGYTIVGVVLLGFVVVDDGVIADVGNGFVVFVNGGVLGVDVGQVGAVVYIDVTVPGIVVDVVLGVGFNTRARGNRRIFEIDVMRGMNDFATISARAKRNRI